MYRSEQAALMQKSFEGLDSAAGEHPQQRQDDD